MLEHVMCWDEQRGWRWIGIEEASRKYPLTVSKNRKVFRCAVCRRHLAFVRPKKQACYFTHTNNSIDCPDKSSDKEFQIYRSKRKDFDPNSRVLPLRLDLNDENKTFKLEIGFAPLPSSLYQKAVESQTKINIHYDLDGTDQKDTFLLKLHLSPFGTTYLPLNNLAAQYRLELSNAPKEINNYWADSTADLSRGVLFDAASRKIIPPNGEIIVGRRYYLLTDRPLSSWGVALRNLHYRPVWQHSSFSKNIQCYQLEIPKFTQYAWEYAEKLGFQLACSVPTMLPVWPPYVANSSLIFCERHKSKWTDYNWIFVKGDFGLRAFPCGYVASDDDVAGNIGDTPVDFYLARVNIFGCGTCGTSVNTIAAGRDKEIVKSLSFWKMDLDSVCREIKPSVKITSGEVLLGEDVYYAPIPKKIIIKAEYDGFVDVMEQDRVINRLKLYPDVPYNFEPRYGQRIVVWQGRDVVREISFLAQRPQTSDLTINKDDLPSDQVLISQLMLIHGNETTIPWTLRSILPKIEKRPLVTQWVCNAIRKGRAPRNAIMLLCQTFLPRTDSLKNAKR